MSINKVYVIGSLRNPKIAAVAETLRQRLGVEVFDDWLAAGPEADDKWKEYEEARGRSYEEALKGYAATHVFNFDKLHLDTADAAVLVLPAGRSAHLEAGYMVGQGKPVYILLDEVSGVSRWDVMYKFVTGVHRNLEDIIQALEGQPRGDPFPYPSFVNGGTFTLPTGFPDLEVRRGPPAPGSAGNWRDIAAQDLITEEVMFPPKGVLVTDQDRCTVV